MGPAFHDLGGAAVSRLARAGATEMEIATITGHAVSDVDPAMTANARRKLKEAKRLASRAVHPSRRVVAKDG